MTEFGKTICAAVIAAAMAAANAAYGYDATLPVPGDGSGVTLGTATDATGATRDAYLFQGVPIAFKYDNYWSYSTGVLEAFQSAGYFPTATYGDFGASTGSGTLDIRLFSGSAKSNTPTINGTTYTFQDSVSLGSGGTPYSVQTWGTGDASVSGPVTVGQILDYLNALNPGNDTPVFFADWNQTGSQASIWAAADVQIIDPLTNQVVGHWSLDSLNNSIYNQNNPTFNFGNISFYSTQAECAANPYNIFTGGCAGVTTDGNDYLDIDHNLGSGSADFVIYSDTMNLSQIMGNYTLEQWRSMIFSVTMRIGCTPGVTQTLPSTGGALTPGASIDNSDTGPTETIGCMDNGFEEVFLSGRIGTPTTSVPEPSALALIGLGLGALAASRRKFVQCRKAAGSTQ